MLSVYLKNYSQNELCLFMESIGEKPFKGKQVFKWIQEGCDNFDAMSNISKELREKLKTKAKISMGEISLVQKSTNDYTRKYLISLRDDNQIEAVFMKYHHGNSICISSQVGCKMGCTFCASGKEGFLRNLEPGEMIEQIHLVEKETGEKISNIVVMGTGEPFDNYDNLIKFIEISNHREGLNISKRKITVSTCGIIPQIKAFSEDMPQVNLTISLHTPLDEERIKIMPITGKYSADEVINAGAEHAKVTGRRVSLEYALIRGINDSDELIHQLCRKLKKGHFHVNLIPLNEITEEDKKASSKETAEKIRAKLESFGIETTIRRELGTDIDAACGQLRLKRK